MISLEICIDTVSGLTAAKAGGADRVELCSALALGGLTPSPGLINAAAKSSLPAHAMIRPQAGDFRVDDALLDVMKADIETAGAAGLAGVVIGALTADRHLDVPRLRDLIAIAGPMEVTLHRAIDLCEDPVQAVEIAANLGIKRILTSGGAFSAVHGTETIAKMVTVADGRLAIMAGSGLTSENVCDVIGRTGVEDVHASASTSTLMPPDIVKMGFAGTTSRDTSPIRVRAIREAIEGL